MTKAIRIHPSAEVSPMAEIGAGTSIWHNVQIRENAVIGNNCILGKGVYIDEGVILGSNVKIQNYVSIYHGVTIEDGVFIGPHVCFTNDQYPRAVNPDLTLKSADDWIMSATLIRQGATLGANSTIICGITIGEWAVLGAGSVVTKDIPNFALAYGNPARIHKFICPCGGTLNKIDQGESIATECMVCGRNIAIPRYDWEKMV